MTENVSNNTFLIVSIKAKTCSRVLYKQLALYQPLTSIMM